MKRIILVWGLLLAALTEICAAPNLNWIPANAKWLLHVDGAAFRKSKIGGMILEKKLEPEVGKAEKQTGVELNFSFQEIRSLTAFGSRVGEGGEGDAVLLLETPADLRADAEKLLARKAENPGLGLPIAKKTENDVEFFKLGEDLFVVPAAKDVWVLSKSKTAALAARAVVLGKAPALAKGAFLNHPAATTNNFFLMAAAETSGAGGLPAQARILQKADGIRLAVGEQGDKLLLNVMLRAKDAETLAQIRDVLQGLKALVTLGGAGNEDLAALSNSARINLDSEVLSVNLSLPLARAMQKVREDK
jgi:hypothetical protein